jgi:hypothetical protein
LSAGFVSARGDLRTSGAGIVRNPESEILEYRAKKIAPIVSTVATVSIETAIL